MANDRPWDFDLSVARAREASLAQQQAENAVREAWKASAVANELYRRALANKILELRADGVPATVCSDLARGDEHVAKLKRNLDIAEGVKEAQSQAAWRKTADRKDVQGFILWSRRRDEEENRLGESIG